MGPGLQVLEIGCGTGMFTEIFAQTGAHILAVDISPDLVALARERGLPTDRVRFLVKRFEQCALDGPFDAVIGSSVLHHLEIPEALHRIFGLLKPGGRLSFAEPNMLNPQVFLERKLRFLFPRTSPDETAFVRTSLRRRLQESGFEQITIRPFDWLHPSTPRFLIPLVRALGTSLEKGWIVREFAGSLCIRARRPAHATGLGLADNGEV